MSDQKDVKLSTGTVVSATWVEVDTSPREVTIEVDHGDGYTTLLVVPVLRATNRFKKDRTK